MAKAKTTEPPNLPQRMKRMAKNGHPDADDLFAAADAYEKASNEFHADRVEEARAWALAQEGIETPQVTDLLAKHREANRVLFIATGPEARHPRRLDSEL
jgi:hypothetical protein